MTRPYGYIRYFFARSRRPRFFFFFFLRKENFNGLIDCKNARGSENARRSRNKTKKKRREDREGEREKEITMKLRSGTRRVEYRLRERLRLSMNFIRAKRNQASQGQQRRKPATTTNGGVEMQLLQSRLGSSRDRSRLKAADCHRGFFLFFFFFYINRAQFDPPPICLVTLRPIFSVKSIDAARSPIRE